MELVKTQEQSTVRPDTTFARSALHCTDLQEAERLECKKLLRDFVGDLKMGGVE